MSDVIAGAELFTGNAFVMFNGLRLKTVTAGEVVKLWIVCFLGNWFGAIVLSLLFLAAAGPVGATGKALAGAAAMKMGLPPLVLFARGILCNVLVCLAVWCGLGPKTMWPNSSWYSGVSMHSLPADLNTASPT